MAVTDVFPGFTTHETPTAAGTIFVQVGGDGPPLLLLHGFPETHLMWRAIAPILARGFTVVAADLPGYGSSACPADRPDSAQMSKRAMAASLVKMMDALGHPRFAVVGHDRGGRVAYRMALDHPDVVTKLAVLDVVPTYEVWERADARLALGFWPFSLLAQPSPLPERLIGAAAEAVVEDALSNWGSAPGAFSAGLRAAYVAALSDPAHVHAICEEYRAAAGIDHEHDRVDLEKGRKIDGPLLALWSGEGGLASWYAAEGGPLGIWRRWAEDVRGEAVPGGHFFPEEYPQETARRLLAFFEPASLTLCDAPYRHPPK